MQLKIQHRDPVHFKNKYSPGLRRLPELPESSEEFLAIAAGLKKTGFIRPILIDENELVIDDHSRTLLRAALRWQLTEVPVQVCSSGDAPMILLHSLAHVRHLSKSAIAYLAYPHLQSAIEAAQAKKLESLRKGQEIPVVHSVDDGGKTLGELAEEIGVSRSLFLLASDVHREFVKDKNKYAFTIDGGARDGDEAMMTLREYFEPKLLRAFTGGEHESSRPLGLGGIIAGIATLRSDDKNKFSSKKAEQLTLFVGTFGKKSVHHFKAWNAMSAEKRREAREQIEAEAQKMKPEECFAAAVTLGELAKIYANAAKAKSAA